MKDRKFIRYVEGLGFSGVTVAPTKAPASLLRGFHFEEVDFPLVRATLGKCRAHRRNLFVFVLSPTRAIRVDTAKRVVLLGNSSTVVQKFIGSVDGNK